MKEKVRSINISINNDYVIWPVDLEGVVKDAELTVNTGCIGLYIVDGVLKSINVPGRSIINSRDEVKARSSIQLIAINTEKTFDILCGVGAIPFHDDEIGVDAQVGAFGDCRVTISNAWAIYNAIGRAPLTADEVSQYAKAKMLELMRSAIADAIINYDYTDIISKQSDIASVIQKKFGKELINIGVEVTSFALQKIHFNEEYIAQRDEYFRKEKEKQDNKIRRREEERQHQRELETVMAIANISNQNPAPVAPAAPAANATQFCTKCGTQIPANAKFCSCCGNKIH